MTKSFLDAEEEGHQRHHPESCFVMFDSDSHWKAERRRFGLAMGEMKRKRAALEDRKEQRALDREGRLAALVDLEEKGGLEVPSLEAQTPVTAEFDNTLTREMFGDVVQVVTTLDSLGSVDQDEAEAKLYLEELATKRQRLAEDASAKTAAKAKGAASTRGPVDEAQRLCVCACVEERVCLCVREREGDQQQKKKKKKHLSTWCLFFLRIFCFLLVVTCLALLSPLYLTLLFLSDMHIRSWQSRKKSTPRL
jgi:hypothetical protein